MKKGFIGVDKAGSISHFPIVISSIYAKEYKTFLDTMKEVRKIAVKEKNIFLNKREIKSRDIKKDNIQKEIVEIIANNLDFFAVIINLRLFEENIAVLFDRFHSIVPLISSHDSKDNDSIAISDLLSGFLMRNKALAQKHKDKICILNKSDIENEIKFLFKL